ncbi:MAG TPA: methylmalonyl-CoA mutase family protein [Frankiaceae bacterium]|nr:methylmalonyl-CoA mutase family protein [Frankiaceae bacterium]
MSDVTAGPTETVDPGAPPAPPEELTLAAAFPAATREQWEKLVAGVVDKSGARGLLPAAAAEKLSVTVGGIEIAGIYGPDELAAASVPDAGFPGFAPFVRGRRPEGTLGGWDVRSLFDAPDQTVVREQVLTDLENGVTSLWLHVGDSGFPLSALAQVLSDVLLDLAPVVLDAGADGIAAARALLKVAADRGVATGSLSGNLGLDPVGYAARTGEAVELTETVAFVAQHIRSGADQLRAIVVDALAFHDAGASEAQELGAALAAGVTYLRALAEAGLSPAQACGQLEFRYAATDDQFLTIAKLRAARRLWSRVASACGAPEAQQGQLQHAVTSWPMMTRRDPYVNMLRTTIAAFAAGVGGADSVTVLPFDSAIGVPDTLGRRIARNTQALLLEESFVAAVIDPAGGSWYVESLTDALAHAGWAEFQAIEEAGGLPKALADGFVAERIAATRRERQHKLAVREDALTGVSEFPQLQEKTLERQAPAPLPGGGLLRIRWAERHEEMRERSDYFAVQHGRPPTVLLVPLGSARAAAARLGFAGDLLRPAGIDGATLDGAGDQSSDDVLAEALKSNATTVACLCGTDDAYSESAAGVAEALRRAGATHVLLAGPAKAAPDAKIDTFIFRGCDAVAVQEQTLTELGVAE